MSLVSIANAAAAGAASVVSALTRTVYGDSTAASSEAECAASSAGLAETPVLRVVLFDSSSHHHLHHNHQQCVSFTASIATLAHANRRRRAEEGQGED